MKVHKEFIDALSKRKVSTVGDLIKSLDLVDIKGNIICDLEKSYSVLEQVYYTVWFLEKEQLIQVLDNKKSAVTFATSNITESFYDYEKIQYLDTLNEENWEKRLKILPSFYPFVANDYMTEGVRQRWVQFNLSLFLAVVAAVMTGFFTKLFDKLF